jgi:hypothetical protein
MKKALFLYAIIMIITSHFFSSCTPLYNTYLVSKEADYTNAYVGKSHNYIVGSLGAPDRQTSDGAGGLILIYEETTTTTTSNSVAAAYNVDYYNKTYTPGVNTSSSTSNNTSYVHFFVNNSNTCYKIKTNHTKLVTDVNEEKAAKLSERNEKLKKNWKKIFGITGGTAVGLGLIIGLICGFAGG